jgi:Holliday junction resolvase RusA-like endonuclease
LYNDDKQIVELIVRKLPQQKDNKLVIRCKEWTA